MGPHIDNNTTTLKSLGAQPRFILLFFVSLLSPPPIQRAMISDFLQSNLIDNILPSGVRKAEEGGRAVSGDQPDKNGN